MNSYQNLPIDKVRRSTQLPFEDPLIPKRDSVLRATLDAFGTSFSSNNKDHAKETKRREIAGFYSSFADFK